MAKNSKQSIIDAATQLIAQEGFEGLRTRKIAEVAGVNHATIHYHFKDKERLIGAVVQSMSDKIYQSDLDSLTSETATVRERLAAYFRNNLQQRRQFPERVAVMDALLLRANRDPAVSRILREWEGVWYGRMQAVLDEGVAAGEFRADLDTQGMAILLISLLRGVPTRPGVSVIEQFTGIYAQIEERMLV